MARVVTTDAQIDAAIAHSRLWPHRVATAVRFDAVADEVNIEFSSGARLILPRRLLQGLEGATPRQLARVQIEGPGTGILWPELDVSHDIPGLIDGVFGTRAWMSAIAKRGGSARSPAKAAAARANGKKGGRPAKRPQG